MKSVFMGTSDFAVPCLKALCEEHEVVGVFTQPDKPKGRGMKLQPTPVKAAALELGLEVFQPEKIRQTDALETLKVLEPECIIVVSYGQILPKSVLELPLKGCINVHASLLPDYRGAAPIHWAILNGEKETGVTTMYMDQGLDTGDMILKATHPIEADTTVGELHDTLADLGAKLLKETLRLIDQGIAPREKQDLESGCYASMIDRKLSHIEWSKSAEDICNQIRGLDPWPAAQTTYQGTVVKVFKPKVVKHTSKALPGEIISATSEGLLIATGTDGICVEEIQVAGSKRMKVSAYILGRTLEEGICLGNANEHQ